MAVHPLRPATDRCLGMPLPHQQANQTQDHPSAESFHSTAYRVLAFVSKSYPRPKGRFLRVTHPFATLPDSEESFRVRLACVMHAASVPSEPGSNSP